LSDDAAETIAVPFFRSLAGDAMKYGVTFCIEPNPAEYGCDWVTTSSEGARLVEAVATAGFGLNLDAGGMTLAGEEAATAIESCAQILGHFHISNPNLAPVGTADDDERHGTFGRALKDADFSGWTSIEMLPSPNTLEAIDTALRRSAQQYG
jgi:sugar phosphate isomerase/epimerase